MARNELPPNGAEFTSTIGALPCTAGVVGESTRPYNWPLVVITHTRRLELELANPRLRRGGKISSFKNLDLPTGPSPLNQEDHFELRDGAPAYLFAASGAPLNTAGSMRSAPCRGACPRDPRGTAWRAPGLPGGRRPPRGPSRPWRPWRASAARRRESPSTCRETA